MTKKKKKEAYEAYKDRLSMPMCPKMWSKQETESYNAENPLPSEGDIQRILKQAGYYD
jgi:hypothetical protein